MTAPDSAPRIIPTAGGLLPPFSAISSWVFALLPANFVPQVISGLVMEYGVSIDVAGIIATGMTLLNAAAVLSVRRLVEHGHRVLVARIGIGILIAVFALAFLLPTAPVIIVALLVSGLGSGITVGAATAGIAATENPDRTTQIGLIVSRTIVAVTFLVLPFVGGNLSAIFAILAGIGVLALVFAQWIPKPPTITAPAAERARLRTQSTAVAWLLAISFAVVTITDDGLYALLQILITTNLPDIDLQAISVLFASSVFSGLAGALAAPFILRFFGRVPSLVVLLTVSAVAKAGLVFITDQGWYLSTSIVYGFCYGAIATLIFGLAATMARNGSAVTLVSGVAIIGIALGPFIGTQFYAQGGAAAFGVGFAAICVAGSIALVVAAVKARPLEKEAEATVVHSADSSPVGIAD